MRQIGVNTSPLTPMRIFGSHATSVSQRADRDYTGYRRSPLASDRLISAVAVTLVSLISHSSGIGGPLWASSGLLCALALLLPLSEHIRKVLAIGFLFAVAAALLATFGSPEVRGTDRFLVLSARHFNIATPVSVATLIGSALIQRRATSILLAGVGVLLLVSMAAYSTAALCLASSAGALAMRRCTRTLLMASLAGAALLAIAIGTNDNRVRRIQEHFSPQAHTYQSTQLEEAWRRSTLATSAPPLHLPSAQHDLALARIAMHRGTAFAAAVVFLQATLVWSLANAWLYGGPIASKVGAFAATFFALSIMGHALVNLQALPPMGIPTPFAAAGGAAQLSFTVLIVLALGGGAATVTHRTPTLRDLTAKYILCAAVVLCGALVVILKGGGSTTTN